MILNVNFVKAELVHIDNGPLTQVKTQYNNSYEYLRFYKNLIVWEQFIDPNDKVRIYNLSTNLETNVSQYNSNQNGPYIWENNIVWRDDRNYNKSDYNHYDIIMMDLKNNKEELITYSMMSEESRQQIHGNYILYASYNFSVKEYALMLYNIKSKNTTKILNNTSSLNWDYDHTTVSKTLNGEFVLIPSKNESNQMIDIYLYEIKTGLFNKIFSLENNTMRTSFFINERYVVWRNSYYYYDLVLRKLIKLNNKTPIGISSIYKDKIVFGYDISIEDLLIIEVFNLSTGNLYTIQIPHTMGGDTIYFPQIYGNKIIFRFRVIDSFHERLYIYNLSWDTDFDGTPDYMDEDDDNDGYNDTIEIEEDSIIWGNTSIPQDFDLDLIPDSTDPDDDNDGYLDDEDKYPLDPTKWKKEEEEGKGFIPGFEFIFLLISILLIWLHRKNYE
ncbi:MAG: hypothetical protein ACFFG0_13730 [Candidatus Thorarchaeota archaeon]